jgi:uncharacterized protein (DUF2235 family)
MAKNIVICCDGTDNQLTINENTNVIHLYSCLKLDDNQIGYYSPGVGTIAPNNYKNVFLKNYYILRDLLSAKSLHGNVLDAYAFLMNSYEEGDKIYLYGFSRGAYTVRMLSGIIEMFGLLHKGNTNHLRYILEVYSKGDKIFETANAFKKRFSRDTSIEFIGVWDTVVSMGGLINFHKSYPYSRQLNIARVVRHAVAIDERRKHFDYSAINKSHLDLKEVFFAGVHSDIGGGYPEEGLSKICFEWMLMESKKNGLIVDDNNVKGVFQNQPPDVRGVVHNSLDLKFKIFDFIPRPRFNKEGKYIKWVLDFRIWPLRKIEEGSLIHSSVFDKIKAGEYHPKNIPQNYEIIAPN